MSAFCFALLLSYLIGSLAGSLILGMVRGVDIRKLGSGNAGATNALRTQGKKFAFMTMLVDVIKGVLAVLVIARVAPNIHFAPHACGLAAVVGHCFPIYFRFQGGKGAGTALGAFGVLMPMMALCAFLVWLLAISVTGYVGLSTVIACVSAIAVALWSGMAQGPALWISCACFTLVALMHHGNIKRLWLGQEFRFDKARVWRRWFSGRQHGNR